MASKWVPVASSFRLLLPWWPPGQYGASIDQWRRPVASGKAMVMLHRAMRFVPHWHTAMAIKMARDGGAFVRRRRLFRLL